MPKRSEQLQLFKEILWRPGVVIVLALYGLLQLVSNIIAWLLPVEEQSKYQFIKLATWRVWLIATPVLTLALIALAIRSALKVISEKEAQRAEEIGGIKEQLEEERAKNARPEIECRFQEVHEEWAIAESLPDSPTCIDHYISLKVLLVNKSPAPATVESFQLRVKTDKGEYEGVRTSLDDLALKRQQRKTSKYGYRFSKVETVLEDLDGLEQQNHAPLIQHVGRKGWLRFVMSEELSPEGKTIEAVTLIVRDFHGNSYEATASKSEWKQTGEIVSKYHEEITRLIEESKEESPKEQQDAPKSQPDEFSRLKLVVNTNHRSEVRVERYTVTSTPPNGEAIEAAHYFITVYLEIHLENNALVPILVKNLEASLFRRTNRGKQKEIPRSKTALMPLMSIDEVVKREIKEGAMTEPSWFAGMMDVPSRYVTRLNHTCFLRVKMEAMRQPPDSVELNVDWEVARRDGKVYVTPKS